MPDQAATAPARRAKSSYRLPRAQQRMRINFDILSDLLSFYMRSVSIELNRDFDHEIARIALAKGTGKTSTLLFVAANPGIRPSVIAHYIFKDRSAMARLLDQLEQHGLIVVVPSTRERRTRELYLTDKGRRFVRRVREIAARQSSGFFAPLSAAEQDELLRLLRKLYEHRLSVSEEA